MKKALSLWLAICLCLSVVSLLTACDKPAGGGGTGGNEEMSGWLLPAKIASSDGTELVLNWSENRCTFEVEGTTYSFVYDEGERSFSVHVDGGADYDYEDLCLFDDRDRISEIRLNGRTVMQLSYGDGKITVSQYGEDELDTPKELTADWEARKIQMPPFDDPEDFLFFTEWGDLYAGEDHTLYDYEYDDKGNILSIAMSDLGEYSWDISYGDSVMTKAWQRAVLKFVLPYVLGRPMAVFAMDMMCFGVYQQHSEK